MADDHFDSLRTLEWRRKGHITDDPLIGAFDGMIGVLVYLIVTAVVVESGELESTIQQKRRLPASPLPTVELVELVDPVDDYPASAKRQYQEGTVKLRLTIDANGKVSNCAIARSSGHDALDKASCRILTRRASFSPALDQSGKPIPSIYHHNMVWKLPPPMPYMSFRTSHGLPALPLWRLTPQGHTPPSLIGNPFSGVPLPPSVRHVEKSGETWVRVIVSPRGRVQRCNVAASSGSQLLDATVCPDMLRRARYIPSRNAQGKPVQIEWYEAITWTPKERRAHSIRTYSRGF